MMNDKSNKSKVKAKVLYIDDEEHNLLSFKAGFRKDFEVHTARSALIGLEVLSEHQDIEVVIADQRMPEMTGVEFFERVRTFYPEKIRILLTGYSDIEAVIAAINKGQVYKFIDKPWDQKSITVAIQNAKELYDTRMELKEKNDSLQKAYDELDKFVYTVSHDMRAPLMSINGVIDLASMEIEDEKALEYFQMIRNMSVKLDRFVYQIMDYYKNSQELSLNDEIWFEEVINDIFDEFQYNPDASGVTFNLDVNQEEPLYSNMLKVRTVLQNIISNSLRYRRTVEGVESFIRVRTTIEGQMAKIIIEDNGIGIAPDKLEKVFEMFYRATDRSGGSGLGLNIVKEALDRLNGTIKISSELNTGTKVFINIPNHSHDDENSNG
ncbi:MAG TPA: hybrid sensor histidine kinase/response regulator [Flavobacteriales bacterium]|jgi:two-component system sensor histidine kinase/response regulator|nr:hybrid sensor histidine kinase/response regulator [Flavobacteriales bacterium]